MITVRKYQEKDRENLLKICIETSGLPTETEKDRAFLNLMYNDYYAAVEGHNCFVAADENDEAVGYILCAENFDRYFKVFKALYLPEIKKLGFNYYTMALGEIAVHSLFRKKYPAHLHIDILPLCQGKGTGTALVNELKAHLKTKGIDNVMLSCGMGNKRAIKFYKKNDFKMVANIAGSCIMVSKF